MEKEIDIDAYDIESLMKSKILVIGDLMLDEFTYGEVSRLSPEAPIPVMKEHSVKKMLGGAGNVYNNLKSIGANVDLMSVIGDDHAGNFLSDLLDVSSSHEKKGFLIRDPSRITTLKKRLYLSNIVKNF